MRTGISAYGFLMLNQTNSQLAKFVSSKPRKRIIDFETPLILLENLSKKLGIELWMKRDVLAGPSFGGNKARQLEYYFGEVLPKMQTNLITELFNQILCV